MPHAPELDRLNYRLNEAELTTKRYMKVDLHKKAFEPGWEDNPHGVEDLDTYPRWGVAGREELVLIDVDNPEMEAIVRSLIPETFECRSPRRGLPHFYLRVRGGNVPNRVMVMRDSDPDGSGEIRAQNHYLVAPGSEIEYQDLVTGETKKGKYTITIDRPIAAMRYDEFLEKFKIVLKKNGDRLTPDDFKRVAAGRRHDRAIRIATYLISYLGLTPDEAYEELEKWDTKNQPPINDPEYLKRTIRKAMGYADVHAEEEAKTEAGIQQLRDEVKPIKKEIKPLHEKGYYWVKGKKGPVFLPDKMLIDIINTFKIITFPDIDVSYLYNEEPGTYTDNAISEVKKFMLLTLADTFKKSVSEEVIYQLKILTSVNREDYEPSSEYFNVSNGVLNVFTRELTLHTPKLFFLDCSPTKYDKDATRPEFDKFINSLQCDKLDALQEFSGYLLEDTPKHKKALMLNGPTDSGKTTFTNAIVNVIGINSTGGIPIQDLEHRFQQQRLYKKRANLCGDLGAEAFNKVGLFKRTTGGDPIEAEIKGANKPLKFIWGGKHWFDVNDMPNTEGDADTDAFYNRLVMDTFPIQLTKDKIDKNLSHKLALESSGILNWMLDGLKRLEANGGFTDSSSIDEIRDHYKRNADNIYSFVQDRCYLKEGEYVEKIESYRKYVQYCINKGYSQKGKTKFYEKLIGNMGGIKDDRREIEGRGKPWVWMNLFISDEDKKDNDPPPPPPEKKENPPPPGAQKDQKNHISSILTPNSDTQNGDNQEVVRAEQEHSEKLVFLGKLGTDNDTKSNAINMNALEDVLVAGDTDHAEARLGEIIREAQAAGKLAKQGIDKDDKIKGNTIVTLKDIGLTKMDSSREEAPEPSGDTIGDIQKKENIVALQPLNKAEPLVGERPRLAEVLDRLRKVFEACHYQASTDYLAGRVGVSSEELEKILRTEPRAFRIPGSDVWRWTP
jgi:P4 family phage/plasmid primase-like protien